MPLTILDSGRKYRKFLVYDLEWVPGSMEVRMIGVYDGDRYRFYTSVIEFLVNELSSKNRGKWFYAHAGGLADIQFVFEEFLKPHLPMRGFFCDGSFSGSSAIIVHVHRGQHAWHFIDSYWLLRDKLANIAKWIGRKKGSTVKGWEEMSEKDRREWYAKIPIWELAIYNREDCEILWHAIDEFQDKLWEIGGQLQMTLASTSMQLFRRKYLNRTIETHASVNSRTQEAYIASRVEDIEEECVDSFYWDINSSFPYAMTQPCPGSLKRTSRRIPDSGIYMADVKVKVTELYLPPIPFRSKTRRIFFPVGTWRSWLTSVDIELLQKEGCQILQVYEVMEFEEFHDLKDFANQLYDIRRNAKSEFEKVVYKLLLNSLYGKFAESQHKQKLWIHPPPEVLHRMREEFPAAMLMPGVWLEPQIAFVPHMHVPISAHITAIARRNLYNFMIPCIVKGVHYCDTDGFSTGEGELIEGGALGQLKLEKKIKEAVFLGPKAYRIDGVTKGKGGEWEEERITKVKGFTLGYENDEQRKWREENEPGRKVEDVNFASLLQKGELPQ